MNIKTKGAILKDKLGLGKFKFVLMQRMLGVSQPIFVISFDSRFPNVLLSMSKIKKLKFTWMGKIRASFDYENVTKNKAKFTPPLRIEVSDVLPKGNAIILLQDLAGEHYRRPQMFECVQKGNKLSFKEVE